MVNQHYAALAHRVIELERLLHLKDPTLKGLYRLSPYCSNLLGLMLTYEYVPYYLAAPDDIGSLRMTVKRLREQLRPFHIEVFNRKGVGYYLTPRDKGVIKSQLEHHGQIPLPLPEPVTRWS